MIDINKEWWHYMNFSYGRAQTMMCKNINECESRLYYEVLL